LIAKLWAITGLSVEKTLVVSAASQGNRSFGGFDRDGLGFHPRQAIKSAFRLATRAIDFSIAEPDKILSRRLRSTDSAIAAISCS
jgi:hypothetical protein